MARTTELQAGKATKARVQRRYELANAPYVARRRNFNTRKTGVSLSLTKALVWSSL
jgi:hypothetical protein